MNLTDSSLEPANREPANRGRVYNPRQC